MMRQVMIAAGVMILTGVGFIFMFIKRNIFKCICGCRFILCWGIRKLLYDKIINFCLGINNDWFFTGRFNGCCFRVIGWWWLNPYGSNTLYFFNISATLATAYSLFVVGITSLIGVIQYRHQLNITIGILFAVPSTLGVILSRRYILQALPNEVYIFNRLLTKDDLVMLVCYFNCGDCILYVKSKG